MALTNLNAVSALTQQLVTTAQIGRNHFGAFMSSSPAAAGMSAWRDGVVVTTNTNGSNNVPNDMQIKQAVSPSLNLTCEAGHCVITRSGQGPYLCYIATQGTLTLAAADTVNPRIDAIVAQVYDTALGDTLPTTPPLASPGGLVIRAVTGTPGGVPAAPATPTGAILLAHVAVAQNATTISNANITDKRRSAFNSGGGRTQLPGDVAVTDNGAVSGELRSTVGTTYPNVRAWTGTYWGPLGIPVYTSTANRNADLGTGQYNGQLAVVDVNITASFGGAWRVIGFAPGIPQLQLRHSVTQLVPNSTWTLMAFDTEDTADAYSNHDPAVNNTRFVVSIPGVYRLTGGGAFVVNGTGARGNRWMKNGVEIPGSQGMTNATTGVGSLTVAKTIEWPAIVNDYFELSCYQGSGGSLNTSATGSEHTTMTVTWVRD